jgi:hypothetical protein
MPLFLRLLAFPALIGGLYFFPVSTAMASEACFTTAPPESEVIFSNHIYFSQAVDPGVIWTENEDSVVNLRQGPGMEYGAVATIESGAEVVMTGLAYEKGCGQHWYRLAFQHEGLVVYLWVHGKYFHSYQPTGFHYQ